MNKKTIYTLLAIFLITGFALLFAGGEIKCEEHNCGPNCPYGACLDASSCNACTIYSCYDDTTGQRGERACTSAPI